MLNDQVVNTRKVLVELAVIPLGGNGRTRDQIAKVQNIVDKTGLYYERTQNGTCIEGDWNVISPLIYACYEQVQEQAPEGFLKISIR
jgi:uncharacterized protein YqgV (UPF0045/DUF77 family)